MNYKTFYPDQDTLADMVSMASVDALIVHHAASSPNATVEDIRRWHVEERKTEGYLWIGYHFVIYQDGEVIQTRPINKRGGHCPENGYNARSLGICLIGNFDNYKPSEKQWTAFRSLIRDLVVSNPGAKVLSHSEAKGGTTACPGKHVMDLLRSTKYEPLNEPVANTCTVCSLSKYTTSELVDELRTRIYDSKN